jgi:hypothetical protein
LQRTYSEISNFSIALFKFLMPTRLFSASIFSRVSFFSATGLSASSNGGPTGRGSLARPSCRRRLKKIYLTIGLLEKLLIFFSYTFGLQPLCPAMQISALVRVQSRTLMKQ